MAKDTQKGRYICKIGFYDVYAKDSMKKSSGRGEKMEVSSTDYCVYLSSFLQKGLPFKLKMT